MANIILAPGRFFPAKYCSRRVPEHFFSKKWNHWDRKCLASGHQKSLARAGTSWRCSAHPARRRANGSPTCWCSAALLVNLSPEHVFAHLTCEFQHTARIAALCQPGIGHRCGWRLELLRERRSMNGPVRSADGSSASSAQPGPRGRAVPAEARFQCRFHLTLPRARTKCRVSN